MKHGNSLQFASRHDAVRIMSVSNILQNARQKFYALRFYFYVYFFTGFPIRQN